MFGGAVDAIYDALLFSFSSGETSSHSLQVFSKKKKEK